MHALPIIHRLHIIQHDYYNDSLGSSSSSTSYDYDDDDGDEDYGDEYDDDDDDGYSKDIRDHNHYHYDHDGNNYDDGVSSCGPLAASPAAAGINTSGAVIKRI